MSGNVIDSLVDTGYVGQSLLDTGFELTGSAVSTGGNGLVSSGLLASPSLFRYWLWGIIKSAGRRTLRHWYWFVGFVAVYCLVVFSYHWIWGKVVVYFQKKGYEEFKNNSENVS